MSKAFEYAKSQKAFTVRPFGLEVDVSKVSPAVVGQFMRDLGDYLSSGTRDVPTWVKDCDYATGDIKVVSAEPLKGYQATRETVKRNGLMQTKNGSIFAGGQQTRWKNLRFTGFQKSEETDGVDAVSALLQKVTK